MKMYMDYIYNSFVTFMAIFYTIHFHIRFLIVFFFFFFFFFFNVF